ncbi:MAG: glycosyltransferase family 4 protein [Candidatus Zixiibacteriota bacterium]
MPEPIPLMILTHNYPRYPGDYAGVFISLLARKLVDMGIRPVVLAPHDSGASECEEIDGVKVYRFRYARSEQEQTIAYRGNMHQLVLGSVSGIFKFKQFLDCFRANALEIIDREQIAVVSGHWLIPSGLVMRTIEKKTGLPMILSSHGTDVRLMRRYMGVAYRYLKDLCRGLSSWTVVSEYLRHEIARQDVALENILSVLPLPHDETIFFRDESIERENNLIVAVTRFTDQKRVDYLIKAFALVVERYPAARLEIYGSGPLRSEIETLIERFGLSSQVAIENPVPQPELRKLYNRAWMVVLNSVREGFGLALSEGMMCGAAAVGVDSGGIPGIIKHEKTGLLVKPDNSSVLADAMVRLIEDDALRERLASDGHRYARQTYASTELARRYADLVHSAAGR